MLSKNMLLYHPDKCSYKVLDVAINSDNKWTFMPGSLCCLEVPEELQSVRDGRFHLTKRLSQNV